MAPANKSPARNPKNPKTPPTDPVITPVRKTTCKTFNGRSTLSYELGNDQQGALHWRITRNTGGGLFSNEWISFSAIRDVLEQIPKGTPITSLALRTLFRGRSVNTPSFLLAALLCEGVVRLLAGKQRHYELGDIAAFVNSVAANAAHSKASKPRANAKSKAAGRMTNAKGTSATDK